MIDVVQEIVILTFIGLFILLPIYVRVFEESVSEYVIQKIKTEQKHKKLRENMEQGK